MLVLLDREKTLYYPSVAATGAGIERTRQTEPPSPLTRARASWTPWFMTVKCSLMHALCRATQRSFTPPRRYLQTVAAAAVVAVAGVVTSTPAPRYARAGHCDWTAEWPSDGPRRQAHLVLALIPIVTPLPGPGESTPRLFRGDG